MVRKQKEQTKAEKLYFRDVGRYKLLTEEEEQKLVEDVHNKIPGAEDKLITANLRFVALEARKHRARGGMSFLELVNEGNLGLLKAAKRFDKENDVKFISYAVWWIRQAIQKAIFDRIGSVHIPANKIALLKRFRQALDKFDGDFDRAIELPKFQRYKDDIIEIIEKSKNTSLDQPISPANDDENSQTLLDTIGVDPSQTEEFLMNELRSEIENVLHILPILNENEEKIIRMYYGINFSSPKTLEEIGAELGITREKVRLTRDKALRKLYKDPDARERLKSFLGVSSGDGLYLE
ncbi:MAG: sigma-70 family RNA polymerase sigma factor [Chitinispirillales bacterium]|jgi:RNA polymerase primary sigma factor|nr:sigma-70 family RNA polymerase sigma factor [Chitinispirillales bacterium]